MKQEHEDVWTCDRNVDMCGHGFLENLSKWLKSKALIQCVYSFIEQSIYVCQSIYLYEAKIKFCFSNCLKCYTERQRKNAGLMLNLYRTKEKVVIVINTCILKSHQYKNNKMYNCIVLLEVSITE